MIRDTMRSRFVEAGWPLHHVQEMLGHADLKQTSTYLNVTFAGLQESMRKYGEAGKLCKPVASESQTDHPPSRNDAPETSIQALVN